MSRHSGSHVIVALGTIAAALALKLAYSRAGANELLWVLAPSCQLARLAGVELHYESGAGFISHSRHLVVGPACAGVNFLVAAWLALYFGLQARQPDTRRKLQWSALSLLSAYAVTLLVNGVRIWLAAHLYELELYGALLTKTRAHALLGVVLYCGALLVLCQLAALRCAGRLRRDDQARTLASAGCERAARGHAALPSALQPQAIQPVSATSPIGAQASHAPTSQPSAANLARRAFGVYLGVVLGLPLLNRAYLHDPARFVEHALLTAGTGALVLLAFTAVLHGAARFTGRRA